VKARPDVVREVFRMFLEARRAFGGNDALDPLRFGLENVRKSLELVIDYAHQQKLLTRRFSVDELFDDTTRVLGG
jgi:4,5-dihydroxyphthalate decarboxylase